MAARVLIPTPLRQFSGQQGEIEVEGLTVGDALAHLTERYPDLRKHLFHPDTGKLRSFVNVFVGDEDIRHGEGDATPLSPDATITIVPSIAGGSLDAGAASGELSREEVSRYSRHLILPEVGMEGQKKLRQASILLVGTGGLGAPLGLYLAAAGVGRLGLVDFDYVDESNLQRQIIHGTKDVGRLKLESARDRISDINPNVRLDLYETALTSENAMEICRDYDIIIDGTDNFPTRYLVNDVCVLLDKPNVYGSIFRFEGQASLFYAKEGPCYRCLYPEPPPPGLVPSCAEGGVLGVLPGIIGTIQATEAIKLIIGQGQTLIGRLVLYDALHMRFRELKLRKDPNCPICGENATIKELIDYQEFCGLRGAIEEAAFGTHEIEPSELHAILQSGGRKPVLLDVRNPEEWDICRLEGATLIPLPELAQRVQELDKQDEVVVYCKLGIRGNRARDFLEEMGFSKARNLRGGIRAWAEDVDPSLAMY